MPLDISYNFKIKSNCIYNVDYLFKIKNTYDDTIPIIE